MALIVSVSEFSCLLLISNVLPQRAAKALTDFSKSQTIIPVFF